MKKIFNKVLKLYQNYNEVLNYLIIGGLTTFINILTKYLLLLLFFDAKNPTELQITVIISWIIAVLFAYITNRVIVFKSKNNTIFKEFINFLESRILTLLFEMAFMYLFVTLLKFNTNIMVTILSVISQILVIILNYILSKKFVFKNN